MAVQAAPSIERIADATRTAVLRLCRRDSCIATTRVLLNVLGYYGLPGRPLPVKAAAYNRGAWTWASSGAAAADWPADAYCVGAGWLGHNRPGQWDGHLVALTPGYLVDGFLDQMSRPRRGICLPGPGVFERPAGWDPASSGRLTLQRADGTVLTYEPTRDRHWRQSPGWSATAAEIREATAATIRALKAGDTDEPVVVAGYRAP